jgi:hypothetical protein
MERGQESQTDHKFFSPTSDNTRIKGPNTEKAQTFADHLISLFQPHSLKIHQEKKKPLPFNWKSLTNSNPRSAGSIDQKFKPSSTTSNLKVPQATTSSRPKSFRNYLPLARESPVHDNR